MTTMEDIHATQNMQLDAIHHMIEAAIQSGTARAVYNVIPNAPLPAVTMHAIDDNSDMEAFAVHIAIELSRAQAEQDASPPPTTNVSFLDSRCPIMHYKKALVDKQCAICLKEFSTNRRVRRLPCGHLFCSVCITKWLVNEAVTCPTCRADVRT